MMSSSKPNVKAISQLKVCIKRRLWVLQSCVDEQIETAEGMV